MPDAVLEGCVFGDFDGDFFLFGGWDHVPVGWVRELEVDEIEGEFGVVLVEGGGDFVAHFDGDSCPAVDVVGVDDDAVGADENPAAVEGAVSEGGQAGRVGDGSVGWRVAVFEAGAWAAHRSGNDVAAGEEDCGNFSDEKNCRRQFHCAPPFAIPHRNHFCLMHCQQCTAGGGAKQSESCIGEVPGQEVVVRLRSGACGL